MSISVTIDRNVWKRSPPVTRLARSAARAALKVANIDSSECDLAVIFADDATVAELNRKWRGKAKPTNVLSFPASQRAGGRFLGDVLLAAGVIEREAEDEGKPLLNHAAHLIVHGVLHLLGYDHGKASAARRMRQMEVRALKSLGMDDPY
ncbi:MAG TPA: rRNA maturation RNase YbeY [Aestuariivirgaceae bacterium]